MHIAIISGGSILPPFLENRIKEDNWDYVIAADRGLEVCYALNFTPDFMIGDFDSISENVLAHYQNMQIPVLTYPSQKDDTDTELALKVALEQKPERVTIYGATGTRIDHMLANISLLRLGVLHNISVEIVDDKNRIRLISDTFQMKKTEQYGDYVSFLPMTEMVTGVTLKGFQYNLTDGVLVHGNSLGVSNQIAEEEVYVSVKNGILIMIESKD